MRIIPQRKAEQMLTAAGFTFRRITKHKVWAHDDGRQVSFPLDGSDLRGFLAHKVRTYARGERLTYQGVQPWVVPPRPLLPVPTEKPMHGTCGMRHWETEECPETHYGQHPACHPCWEFNERRPQ